MVGSKVLLRPFVFFYDFLLFLRCKVVFNSEKFSDGWGLSHFDKGGDLSAAQIQKRFNIEEVRSSDDIKNKLMVINIDEISVPLFSEVMNISSGDRFINRRLWIVF